MSLPTAGSPAIAMRRRTSRSFHQQNDYCPMKTLVRLLLLAGVALNLVFIGCLGLLPDGPKPPHLITSPNGSLGVGFFLADDGSPHYWIKYHNKPALDMSHLGLVRDDVDFTRGLKLRGIELRKTTEEYEILTSKRRMNTYAATKQVFHLQAATGQKLDIIFQVSNDGVAFRYVFPETDEKRHQLKEEATSFRFFPETRAWLQPMSVAKTGWRKVTRGFEETH